MIIDQLQVISLLEINKRCLSLLNSKIIKSSTETQRLPLKTWNITESSLNVEKITSNKSSNNLNIVFNKNKPLNLISLKHK